MEAHENLLEAVCRKNELSSPLGAAWCGGTWRPDHGGPGESHPGGGPSSGGVEEL